MDTAGRAWGALAALAVGLLGCEPVNRTEVPNRVPYVVLAMLHTPEGVSVYHDVNASLACGRWKCRPNPESCASRPPPPPPPPLCLDYGYLPPPADAAPLHDAAPPDATPLHDAVPADATPPPDAAPPDATPLHDAAPPDAAPADASPPPDIARDAAPPVDAGPPVPASMALTPCISLEEYLAWPYNPRRLGDLPYPTYNPLYVPQDANPCYEDAPAELCECVGGRIITADDGVVLVMDDAAPIAMSSFHGLSPIDGWIEVTDTWSVDIDSTRYITHHGGAFELDLPDGVQVRSGLFYPSREK